MDLVFEKSRVRPTTILLVHLSPTIRAGCLLTVPVPIIAGFRLQRSPHQEPTLLRVPALGASVAQPAGHMALRLRPHRQTRTRGENVKKHIYIADVDLVGGYYDAGDNVKFGLSMAFTITMLSSGVIEYHQQMVDAGKLRHALEAINRGTYYFIKAHTHPNVLWVQVLTFLLVFPLTYLRSPTQKLYAGETRNDQVGDGDTDHYCWQRPEDMTTSTTSKRVYKVDTENPGTEVAAETAAAMATATILFRETNPHYSHMLLHHARQRVGMQFN
ncbi:hypothetical protein SAY86_030408 [Trapa natans]|uniref:cellulase n=1 Tax=Trapa natans TaxID=22666 RepID=A0AAN7MG11_TRANT|nr:hypothetical protein SAY86_030408 [Trapa natans]